MTPGIAATAATRPTVWGKMLGQHVAQGRSAQEGEQAPHVGQAVAHGGARDGPAVHGAQVPRHGRYWAAGVLYHLGLVQAHPPPGQPCEGRGDHLLTSIDRLGDMYVQCRRWTHEVHLPLVHAGFMSWIGQCGSICACSTGGIVAGKKEEPADQVWNSLCPLRPGSGFFTATLQEDRCCMASQCLHPLLDVLQSSCCTACHVAKPSVQQSGVLYSGFGYMACYTAA